MNAEDDTTMAEDAVPFTEENGAASDDGTLSSELPGGAVAFPVDQSTGSSMFPRSAFVYPGRVCHSDDSEVRRMYQPEFPGFRRIYHSLSDHGLYPYLSSLGLSTVATSEPGEAGCPPRRQLGSSPCSLATAPAPPPPSTPATPP